MIFGDAVLLTGLFLRGLLFSGGEMRKIIGIFCLLFSAGAFAAIDVPATDVVYVYQLDSEPTTFEFHANVVHGCGSAIYRVKSADVAVANRKFALVLAAFLAGKKVLFHDTQGCEGSRSVVSWVRLVN